MGKKQPSDEELARNAVEGVLANGVPPEAPLTGRLAGEQAAMVAFVSAREALSKPRQRKPRAK